MKNKIIGVQLFIFAFCISWIQGQNVVNFTSDEGFTNGALYNQTGWDSNFQTATWNGGCYSRLSYPPLTSGKEQLGGKNFHCLELEIKLLLESI